MDSDFSKYGLDKSDIDFIEDIVNQLTIYYGPQAKEVLKKSGFIQRLVSERDKIRGTDPRYWAAIIRYEYDNKDK